MKTLSILKTSTLALILLSTSAFAQLQPDKAAQDKMTPESVLTELKDGNSKYTADTLTDSKLAARIQKSVEGQFPKAYVLSCVDSRVPVENVFDQGLGDLFVGRVAGNIENDDQLGSMEYAVAVGGVKLLVVMGHESCGAVKSACKDIKLGNASALLQKIRPAVRQISGGDKAKENTDKDFVKAVVKANVLKTVKDIRERSEVLAEAEKVGTIKIVGAYYNLGTGKVDFL